MHWARARQVVAATELKLTEAALHRMPKALGAWAHRRCVALPCIALRPCHITTRVASDGVLSPLLGVAGGCCGGERRWRTRRR